MTRDEILTLLLRWNFWWKGEKLKKTIPRNRLKDIENFTNYNGIVTITGPRRAGKSTLMYQLIEKLTKSMDPKSLLYVNFEDYAFSSENLQPETLDGILEIYRQEIYNGQEFLLFFDEIQNVSNWYKWLRTAIDSNQLRTIFITGSSSKLLSSELASTLTGRHMDFDLFPFSFDEYVKAMGYRPFTKIDIISFKNEYLSLLKNYIIYGGFPEVILNAKNEMVINKILSQYAEDIILKDVASRYNIGNFKLLKFITKYIAQNIGNRISIRKIQRNLVSVFGEKNSTSTISDYISYLENAYFCFEVPKFHYSIKKTFKSPSKYYLIDTGLRNAIFPSFTPDKGRLLENVIYLKLRTMCKEIYYWENKNEIDFVCRNDTDLILFNVSYVSHIYEIKDRELKGLAEFPYSVKERYLITWDLNTELTYNDVKIKVIPAYLFLLDVM